ncbi:ferredoxin [Candidatus Saccharibacteria bacterium]|nr:ferredoxin [Candidatus Saccharibacteria bacterium]
MKVWIDQNLCTGDGLCAAIASDVFVMGPSGVAFVQDKRGVFDDSDPDHPAGSRGLAEVPSHLESDALEAADECPGACIFISD